MQFNQIDFIVNLQGDQNFKNECGENNGGCSNLCLRNPVGYSCACPTGIAFKNESEPSPKICKDHPDNFLVFATRGSIAFISLDTPEQWDVTLPLSLTEVQNSIAVDFHWEQKLIFYTDLHLDVIRFGIWIWTRDVVSNSVLTLECKFMYTYIMVSGRSTCQIWVIQKW